MFNLPSAVALAGPAPAGLSLVYLGGDRPLLIPEGRGSCLVNQHQDLMRPGEAKYAQGRGYIEDDGERRIEKESEGVIKRKIVSEENSDTEVEAQR